jgi:hypothetical protein
MLLQAIWEHHWSKRGEEGDQAFDRLTVPVVHQEQLVYEKGKKRFDLLCNKKIY